MCVYIYIYGLYCGGFFDLGFLCLLHLVDLIVFQLEFEWLPIGISYCSFLPFILCMDLGVKTQLDYLQQCLPGNFSLMV
jgi:ABC-type microcin C transport system permease subunit YejE